MCNSKVNLVKFKTEQTPWLHFMLSSNFGFVLCAPSWLLFFLLEKHFTKQNAEASFILVCNFASCQLWALSKTHSATGRLLFPYFALVLWMLV